MLILEVWLMTYSLRSANSGSLGESAFPSFISTSKDAESRIICKKVQVTVFIVA